MKAIDQAVAELDRCIENGELGVDADEVLHDAICKAADNSYFVAARNSMKANILTGMSLTRNLSLTKTMARLELVQQEHYDIVDAIRKKDRVAADAAMRRHIDNAKRRVFEGD